MLKSLKNSIVKPTFFFGAAALLFIVHSCNQTKYYSFSIIDKVKQPGVTFGIGEFKKVCGQQGHVIGADATDFTIVLDTNTVNYSAEEFQISLVGKDIIQITGGDNSGLMYGVLELAEQLSFGIDPGKIENIRQKPFIEKRGIKMNIPLDARLPSYDDTGDAAQNNIAEVWSMDFWKEYLDNLARNRYNVLTLWTKHPFPGLIKMKDFPDVALDDVYSFAGNLTPELHKDWNGVDLFASKNLKLVKKMSIDEKIKFWQDVMLYAHNRGIEIYLFTWNIYVTGAEKYGIKPTDEAAIPYMKECVKEFALTYPYLAGIGVTAGEEMGAMVGKRTNVEWLRDTYGEGIKEALKENPNRKIRFIFRRHHTNLAKIDEEFKPWFPGKVETSFKYSFAHMYSTTTPPRYDNEYAKDVEKYGYKCWMNLRNDDNFTFRWGNPEYVRQYLTKMASYPIAGFYIGSDGYVWGREFTTKNEALSGELEVTKYWFREMLWGRLAFDPGLSEDFLLKKIQQRFPNVDASMLYKAWKCASEVYPLVTGFHWKGGDSMWSIEGCFDIEHFHTLRDFINAYAFETGKIMNIPDFADVKLNGKNDNRISPIAIADSIEIITGESFKLLRQLTKSHKKYSEELKETLADIEAMDWMGKYYSAKIKAATFLHLHETALDAQIKEGYKEQALVCVNEAVDAWKKYAENAAERYKVQLLARTQFLDWKAITHEVEKDIQIIEESTGSQPKIAKVFYREFLWDYPELRGLLKQYIVDCGFEYEELRAWELHGHATGFRICIMKEGDLSFEEFLNAGGIIPDSYMKKGFAIVEHHGVTWILGKNEEYTSKAVVEFLRDRKQVDRANYQDDTKTTKNIS